MIRAYSALELSGNLLVGAFKDLRAGGQRRADQPARRLRRLRLPESGGRCRRPTTPPAAIMTAGSRPTARPTTAFRSAARASCPVPPRSPVLNPARIDVHVTDLSDPRNPKHLMNVEPLAAAAGGLGGRNYAQIARGDQLPRRQHQPGRHARLHGALRRQQLARRQQQQPDPGAEPALLERAADPRLVRRRQPRAESAAPVHQLPVLVRPADRPRLRRRLHGVRARDRVRAATRTARSTSSPPTNRAAASPATRPASARSAPMAA